MSSSLFCWPFVPFHPYQYRNLIPFCLEFDGGYGESIKNGASSIVVEKTIRFFAVSLRCHVGRFQQFSTFVYFLINSFIWLRHPSTQHQMRIIVLPLYWCRVGDSCRNLIFCGHGKSLCVVVGRRHFLRFVYLLINCFTCLRHPSTQR